MKKNHLMKLFALLLLVSTVLVGCGKDDGASRPKKKAEVVNVTNGSWSDFVKNEYVAPLAPDRYEQLPESYGQYVDMANGVILFRAEKKDYMNNVTETYRLYSVESRKVILELSNTYPDANYGEADKHGNEKLIPNDLEVFFVFDEVPYVKAVTTNNLRLSDEEIEENEYDKSYLTSYVTAYYDFAGKKITETTLDVTPTVIAASTFMGAMPLTCKCSFGDKIVLMNAHTGKMISSYGFTDGTNVLIYDYEDKYSGYVLPTYMNGMPYVPEVQVYEKSSGKVTLRYSYDPSAAMTLASVLNNGDILVQSLYHVADGGAYDLVYNELPMELKSLIIDIDSGAVKSVETEYFFQMVFSRNMLESVLAIAPDLLDGMEFSDNLLNYGMGMKYGSEGASAIVFFDSALSVQAEILDEPSFSGYPTDTDDDALRLPNGSFLVEAEDGVDAEYVIVNDKGEAVVYLPVGTKVFGEWIVIGSNVYDLNLKYLATLPNADRVELKGIFGDRIYGVRSNYNSETQQTTYDFIYYRPYYEGYGEDEESRELRFDSISWSNTEMDNGGYSYSEDGSYVVVKRMENGEARYVFHYGDNYLYSDEPIIVERVGDVYIGVFVQDGVSQVYRFYEYDEKEHY